MTSLSIIILSFNTKDLILDCLISLFKQYEKEITAKQYEIIVVDNASTDTTLETLRTSKMASKIKIISNDKNYGFAKGCNIGVKHANGINYLFLNSDTQVEDHGISSMVEYLEKEEEIGILGGRLENPDGTVQETAGSFYTVGQTLLMLIGLERAGFIRTAPNTISKVDWVSGGAMMVKKSVFEKLKGFDEHFFMYMEDMELCFRAKNLGYLTYYYPSVTIIHREHGSSNRSFAVTHIYEGILYFYWKHKTPLEYRFVRFILRFKAQVLILVGKILDNTYLTKTYEEALAIS